MREILFRAWDEYRKNLVINILTIKIDRNTQKPCLIVYTDKKINAHNEIKESDKIYCNQFKLMQFTGLTDKNGTKIFEGDIVDIHQTVNGCNLFEIVWDKCKWNARYYVQMITTRLYEYNFEELMEVNEQDKEIEIIGNIHEKWETNE